jgi:cellulose synthase/poly-beta-1,6-N-acetylglucosamine synthase-like glycosyltransferase
LHEPDSPLHLSTDFSTPLRAWRRGYRSVSVDEAICYVRRTPSLLAEYRRKVRTMSRGLQTLWNERDLLDLRQHGRFAFVLWSHKLIRWLTFLLWPLAFPGIALLATQFVAARALLVAAVIGLAVGLLALRWPPHLMMPRVVAVTGFVVASHIAGFAAWVQALRGPAAPTWEPTRRQSVA